MIFSMPPGTPPEKVLGAVRVFAREEFALQNRYAMVLHTDEPHPHVHLVVKAIGEDGERLNIRKPTLRRWRHEFARRMREQGIDANATERGARGRPGRSMADGLYRIVGRREGVGPSAIERAQSSRGVPRDVQRGWDAVAAALGRAEAGRDAADVGRFVSGIVRQPTSSATEKDQPVGRSR
jgi:hypothetical protein